MTLATVDEVIELWLQFSGERWDRERSERTRTHPWPRYLTQVAADELNEGGIRLLASTQPFTWGFWYRRIRRLAVARLGPIPPGARITPSATSPPTPPSSTSTSPGRSAGQTALQRAQAALRAGDAKTALDIARRTLTDNGALPASMTAREAADMVLAAFLGDVRDLRGLTEAASDAERWKRYPHSLAPLESTKRGSLGGNLDQIAAVRLNLERGTSCALRGGSRLPG